MEKKEETPVKGIVKALGIFQQECPAIKKDSKSDVKTKSGATYSYKYGSLPHILEVIKPHMKKANLAFTQPIVTREGVEYILTILYHTESGEKIESKMELPKIEFQGMNELQAKGSAITYLRRYGLMSVLGIVAEEDDNDAAGKSKPRAAQKKTTTPSATPAPVSAAKVVEKPWLNPEVDGKPNPLWNEALKYLANAGKIGDIKKKYRIGKNNEEKLLNDAITYDDLPFDRKDAEDAEIASTANGEPNPLDKALSEAKPGEPNKLFDDQGESQLK